MIKIAGVGFLILLLAACTTVHTTADPKRASELNAQLGLGYLKQGQYKRAMLKLDKALDFDPSNANAYHYKAELYRRINDYDKAEELFLRAMELAPESLTIQNNYGVFLCDKGQYEEAIKLFKKPLADALYTERSDTYENIGLCRLRQGLIAQAENAFVEALKFNPKASKSLLNLAQIRFDSGNKVAAYDLYSRYLAVAPHTPESLWLGILLEHERGAKNTVASYKVKLKGKYPDSKETKLLLKLERQGKI